MIKVLAVGTIMIDILAVELEKIAQPGEVVYLDREIEVHIGGHPIDVGIDLIRLGANPREIGVVAAIGKGFFGNYAKKIIRKYKVRSFLQKIKRKGTGTNLILEKKGEDRRFHPYPGANWYLNPEFVKRIIRKYSPKIFCVRPGYSGIDLDLEEIFEEVKAKDCLLFLDIMQSHPQRPAGFLLPLFHYVDIVHCNEKEAMINTGKDNLKSALKEMLKRGVKVILLTKGNKGAELITEGFRILQPQFETKTIDATGCGDAFCAGVVYKLMEYDEFKDMRNLGRGRLKETLMFAQAAGAAAATKVGCVEGVSAEKVSQIIKRHGDKILNNTIEKPGF